MSDVAFPAAQLRVGAGVVSLSSCPTNLADVIALRDWGADLLVTLLQVAEYPADLADNIAAAGLAWRQIPIADFGLPERQPDLAPIDALLAHGGRVALHCRAGCGRSGMIALRLMRNAGEAGPSALQRLRQVRPCAVETAAQYDWAATPTAG